MGKERLENAIREEYLESIRVFLADHYETDVLYTDVNKLMIPTLDAEGNERYAVITVTVPRGTRSGGTYIPYNGYEEAEQYEIAKAEAQAVKAAKEADKAAKEAEKEKKRAERKAQADAKKALIELRKLRINKGEGA